MIHCLVLCQWKGQRFSDLHWSVPFNKCTKPSEKRSWQYMWHRLWVSIYQYPDTMSRVEKNFCSINKSNTSSILGRGNESFFSYRAQFSIINTNKTCFLWLLLNQHNGCRSWRQKWADYFIPQQVFYYFFCNIPFSVRIVDFPRAYSNLSEIELKLNFFNCAQLKKDEFERCKIQNKRNAG